jgi:hypothetical protein
MVALAAVFVVFGWIVWWHPWTDWVASGFGNASNGQAAAVFNSQCDYAHRKLELGSEPVAFNPGARCAYNFTVAEGAVEFDGPDGSVVVKANTPVQQHLWIETARAVNGHAVLLYQLYPPAH